MVPTTNGYRGITILALSAPVIFLLVMFVRRDKEIEQTRDKNVVITSDEEAEQWRRDTVYDGKDQGPLRCRLTPWVKRLKGEGAPDLRLELTNTSQEPVTIWYTTYPHFQVTFLVRDEAGKILKEFFLERLSSLGGYGWDESGRLVNPPPILTLKPGQTYTASFYLSSLQEYLEAPRGPGRYQLEAVFAQRDFGGWPAPNQRILTRSEPVPIEVARKAPGALRATWKLAD